MGVPKEDTRSLDSIAHMNTRGATRAHGLGLLLWGTLKGIHGFQEWCPKFKVLTWRFRSYTWGC